MKSNFQKKSRFKWFTWHIFPQPKDVPIQSVYEILFFGLIFLICAYIYHKCNQVPYCQETFHIECLDNKNPGDKYGNDYLYPEAYINLRMPCTSVDELRTNKAMKLTGGKVDDNYLSVQFTHRLNWFDISKMNKDNVLNMVKQGDLVKDSFNRINRIADSLLIDSDAEKQTQFRVFKDSVYKGFSIIANKNYRKQYSYSLKELNEKYDLFTSLHGFFALPEKSIAPLYYYNLEQTVRKKYLNQYARLQNYFTKTESTWKKAFTKDTILGSVWDNISLQRTEYRNKEICQEGFCIANSSPRTEISDPYEIAIGDPGWLSFEDISQAYYHFKIISETIDSIQLRINFVGSTEFSTLVPEPDELTMSSIVYYDSKKIDTIKRNGLLFHAKFIELENRQNIRMFFLTATMSALFTIFIGFLVLALYKIATNRSSKQETNSLDYQNHYGRPPFSES